MPIIALIGVRISWLMFARKFDLSRVASSASSLVSFIAFSIALRSAMSLKMMTDPVITPSLITGVVEYSTGKDVPSFRHRTSSSTCRGFPSMEVRNIGHASASGGLSPSCVWRISEWMSRSSNSRSS